MNDGNEPLYPYTCIEQYGASTKKRFIDDILTVALGSQPDSPTFEQVIKQEGSIIYGGMHPTSVVEDIDGLVMGNPISITKDQSGETVHLYFSIWKYSKADLACHR